MPKLISSRIGMMVEFAPWTFMPICLCMFSLVSIIGGERHLSATMVTILYHTSVWFSIVATFIHMYLNIQNHVLSIMYLYRVRFIKFSRGDYLKLSSRLLAGVYWTIL